MMQRGFKHVAAALALATLLMAVAVPLAGAYAEEPITFRDPLTGQADETVQVSTVHTDITYVLALAAGFSKADSETLAIWDQLVDTNVIVTGDGKSYSNCTGAFPPKLEPCNDDPLFWPSWNEYGSNELPPPYTPGKDCVTSRYGPFEGFFHFPHRDGWEMASLKAWAWGDAQDLEGYQGFVWGQGMKEANGFTGYSCMKTQRVTVETGMAPGSLEAFATYLHSLADSYSHQECQKKTDGLGWAWPTHTAPQSPSQIYECNYLPNQYISDLTYGLSHHGREFGSEWIKSDSRRTDRAIEAVYEELAARSTAKDGAYKPLELKARLKVGADKLTLEEALYKFVHEWNFMQPDRRRAYANDLAQAVLARRVPRN